MGAGSADPAAALRVAYDTPWAVAEAWRARHDGLVVGVVGWSVPRELIAAAGMLPLRLSPLRLAADGEERHGAVPAGLARELSPPAARVLGALLTGALDWIDALVIGRDSEAHTKLFYVLRELHRLGEGPIERLAFYDLLRLPHRTSARYNRLGARELLETLAGWGRRRVQTGDLQDAVRAAAVTAAGLRRADELRTAGAPAVSGSAALVAAGAAQVLPGAEAGPALARWLDGAGGASAGGDGSAGGGGSAGGAGRVFVTGSGQDDPWTYEALQDAGLEVVGEDHEWGDDGLAPAAATADPVDGVVDRYHLSARGAARAGLGQRVAHTAARVAATAAAGVLQIVFEHDVAPEWETAALRGALGESVPVISVRLPYGSRAPDALHGGASALREAVAGA